MSLQSWVSCEICVQVSLLLLKVDVAKGEKMKVDVWSDVVCPWCYIGKRRLEAALENFDGRDEVEINWRSFELDPSSPKSIEEDMATRLSKKYRITKDDAQASIDHISEFASEVGLDYHLESAKMGNSFDAHRLIKLAGLTGLAAEMKERLLKAYFVESLDISDFATLRLLGKEVGMNESDIDELQNSDYMAQQVRDDEALAGTLGISGVPFFVFESKYGVSGAQSTEVFLDVLNKVRGETSQIQVLTGSGDGACDDDSLAI